MTKNQLCSLWRFRQVQTGNCSEPFGALPFPALKQLLHGFERPQISPERKSTFFPNKRSEKVDEKRLWLGHCSLTALKAVFEPGSPSSAGSRLTKAQPSPACKAGEGCTQAILTLYRPLAEYFGSWGSLEMPHGQKGLSRCASGRLPTLCISGACLSP